MTHIVALIQENKGTELCGPSMATSGTEIRSSDNLPTAMPDFGPPHERATWVHNRPCGYQTTRSGAPRSG